MLNKKQRSFVVNQYLESAKIFDAAREGGVPALGYGHISNAPDKLRRLAHRS
jgi:acetyl/propionyl-CoA carboxylase alpha subunit